MYCRNEQECIFLPHFTCATPPPSFKVTGDAAIFLYYWKRAFSALFWNFAIKLLFLPISYLLFILLALFSNSFSFWLLLLPFFVTHLPPPWGGGANGKNIHAWKWSLVKFILKKVTFSRRDYKISFNYLWLWKS